MLSCDYYFAFNNDIFDDVRSYYMKYINYECYSKNSATIRRVAEYNGDKVKFIWHLLFKCDIYEYSYYCDQWSDVLELLEAYNFGDFIFDKEREV